MYCAIKYGQCVQGNTLAEIASKLILFQLDTKQGILYISGHPDSITYTTQEANKRNGYTPEEMQRVANKRMVTICKSRGWTFYKALE